LRFLNSLGVYPTLFLNMRVKCCGYLNPKSKAISLRLFPGSKILSFAISITFCWICS